MLFRRGVRLCRRHSLGGGVLVAPESLRLQNPRVLTSESGGSQLHARMILLAILHLFLPAKKCLNTFTPETCEWV